MTVAQIVCDDCALANAEDPSSVPYTAVCQSLATCDLCGQRIAEMAGYVLGDYPAELIDGIADLTTEMK